MEREGGWGGEGVDEGGEGGWVRVEREGVGEGGEGGWVRVEREGVGEGGEGVGVLGRGRVVGVSRVGR